MLDCRLSLLDPAINQCVRFVLYWDLLIVHNATGSMKWWRTILEASFETLYVRCELIGLTDSPTFTLNEMWWSSFQLCGTFEHVTGSTRYQRSIGSLSEFTATIGVPGCLGLDVLRRPLSGCVPRWQPHSLSTCESWRSYQLSSKTNPPLPPEVTISYIYS